MEFNSFWRVEEEGADLPKIALDLQVVVVKENLNQISIQNKLEHN